MFEYLACELSVDGSQHWDAKMIFEAFKAKYPNMYTGPDGQPCSVFYDVEDVEAALVCEVLEYDGGRWSCWTC